MMTPSLLLSLLPSFILFIFCDQPHAQTHIDSVWQEDTFIKRGACFVMTGTKKGGREKTKQILVVANYDG